jgi:hypothetical protein
MDDHKPARMLFNDGIDPATATHADVGPEGNVVYLCDGTVNRCCALPDPNHVQWETITVAEALALPKVTLAWEG